MIQWGSLNIEIPIGVALRKRLWWKISSLGLDFCVVMRNGNGEIKIWDLSEEDAADKDVAEEERSEIDHVRVHPKFLHSNATSHKWALGALAELLDNSMDEVCNGATYVSIDVLDNPKDKTKMLLVEDNGGGMDPNKMRQCMSLGYSMKSKSANTIGQYGNGFKTSTMRLGADVIVFSRCQRKNEMGPTQSIGMLSYTFLKNTGKQDIIVPMVDYQKRGDTWHQIEKSSSAAWKTNMDSILQWSPYCSEDDLLQQPQAVHPVPFCALLLRQDQGSKPSPAASPINNASSGPFAVSNNFPENRHFIRRFFSPSYASILYLRLPQGFRMILRGKEIEHHNIVNDMMLQEEKTYRPQPGPDGVPKNPNIFAVVTIGFVKDATSHIDVQGFNVYHKNRLIKPFWRVWNAAGSDGRGVIGVLEANFIEPAHDKQGFERTTVLNRLEARLLHIQKTYWSSYCHMIGYAPRRQRKSISNSDENEMSPEPSQLLSSTPMKATTPASPNVVRSQDSSMIQDSCELSLHHGAIESKNSAFSDELMHCGSLNSVKKPQKNGYEKSTEHIAFQKSGSDPSSTKCVPTRRSLDGKMGDYCYVNGRKPHDSGMHAKLLADGKSSLKDRINTTMEDKLIQDLQIEREKNKELIERVEILEKKLKVADEEHEALISMLVEERDRNESREERLRKKMKVATDMFKPLENLAKMDTKIELQPL
ncbi:hypothetical protein KSP40_PGU022672 [Platanthera guangdongensis]|uniref:Morc S5 domain-containing protein n=1 Tax=Platanthera guangdongensis TaxID=2320717 RepID=A0ABR2MMB3_9ASPA